ncbi:glycosyl transferase family 90 [Sulfitobacter guttiformis]|uniref:Glycosyl transferase family 90 n=1 Tax=Sulfitobacter guttiformis TaxID=74349 RepID=A0A420DP78_9RHOB|nr:glycosyl transferase family 90 [Sulfitobacter guttiformis]KIN73330.1 Lipopolysaccharide core biosynthesis protein lpsA [Sulfitobacter guttiformis KCTC 32187]RKE96000.1 glycosyl transferase family 90 [Sulfitobacter guttiformis]
MITHDTSKLSGRLSYYAQGLFRQFVPYAIAKRHRDTLLAAADDHPDLSEIDERVAYYNKLTKPFDASSAPHLCDMCKDKSRYFLDLDEHCKGFSPRLRLEYLFGDVIHVPAAPTVVKSRPIYADHANSVILNLDKLRHFRWEADPLPFKDKKPSAVWRGTPLTHQRQEFVKMFYNHPTFEIGHSRHLVDGLPAKDHLTHRAQMEHKFFVSIEGNDVATNLKWAMASNMLVMSPLPRYESWFMEGRLEPDRHFVLLKDDLSDLEEKVEYYATHTQEAEEIIRNAHAWIGLFTDPMKESIISTRVLEKYFRLSGQLSSDL